MAVLGDTALVVPESSQPQMLVAQFLQTGISEGGDVIFDATPAAYTTPPDGSPISDYFTIGDGLDLTRVNFNPSGAKSGFYSAQFKASASGSGSADAFIGSDQVHLVSAGISGIGTRGSVFGAISAAIPPWPYSEICRIAVEIAMSGSPTIADGIITVCYYGAWDTHGVDYPDA